MSKPLLGCIADDFTGATDLANNLVRSGMSNVKTIGVPEDGVAPIDADAIIVALKSRTIAPADAVAQSLQALSWLRAQGVQQVYFKYCSAFDSTPAGNIGPVTDALLDALSDLPDSGLTIACPAFPENQRSVFKGHLFVGNQLLRDSGMRNHPLTPMTDVNLVRVMQAQTRHKVGLPQNWPRFAQGPGQSIANRLPPSTGLQAVVSGSCSLATNAQVLHFKRSGRPSFAVDPLALAAGEDVVGQALAWAGAHVADGAVLVYATAEAADVASVQSQLGVARAGEMVEQALSEIAVGLVERGVRQLVVAGGETSGAVVRELGVRQMLIGPQIDPGVPWTSVQSPACAGEQLHVALKSGSFGTLDFFTKAFAVLEAA